MCKNSNVFSLPVLIRREAWPPFFFKTVRQDGSKEKRQARHISTIIQQIRQQTLYLQHSSSPRSSSFFLIYFFPVSIAGLKLTFPSRTRSIRGLTTMVLHNRVWESSSMPGFFFLDLVLFSRVQGLFFTIYKIFICCSPQLYIKLTSVNCTLLVPIILPCKKYSTTWLSMKKVDN